MSLNVAPPLDGLLHRADTDDVGAAARALESYFLRQVFAELRKTTDAGLVSGGFAGATFKEMLDGALADAMAQSQGVGLADMIEKEFARVGTPAAMGRTDAVAQLRTVDAVERGAYPRHVALLSVAPVQGRITSAYGVRSHPLDGAHDFHSGVDVAAPEGTPVVAAGAGTVVQAGPAGGYGNLVVVDHGGGLESRYAHLSAIHLVAGQQVAAGVPLGRVGATGRVTGPHLHFEV